MFQDGLPHILQSLSRLVLRTIPFCLEASSSLTDVEKGADEQQSLDRGLSFSNAHG